MDGEPLVLVNRPGKGTLKDKWYGSLSTLDDKSDELVPIKDKVLVLFHKHLS